MKRLCITIGLLMSILLQISATQYTVVLKTQQRKTQENSTTMRRTPMHLPIEVVYDNETRQVEVSGDEEMAAQVYLCDENGNTLDSANSVNAVLNVPETYSGLLIIRVESEEWIATGKIAV